MKTILWLAPMDGITDYIYRRIVQEIFDQYGDHDNFQLWKWTEFMSANGYMINPSRLVTHLTTSSDEQHLRAQIYWWNIDTLLKTAQDIERKYPFFTWIELNIGCPSPKILACWAWSGMLENKPQTLEYIKILSEATTLPFSIKTRSWLHDEDKEEQYKFIIDAAHYCPLITIHGRVQRKTHSGDIDWDFIYKIKEEVGSDCMIIGNGWIKDLQDENILRWKLDGYMIGQAAMQNPRVFVSHEPSESEKITLALHHLKLMGAYEVYVDATRKDIPEIDNQLAANKRHLHLEKKYDPDSDEVQDIPTIDFHDYVFPFPDYAIIDEIATIIFDSIQKNSDFISRNNFTCSLSSLRSWIQFRKYLFGYIKWLPYTKELKQKIIATKDIGKLYRSIASYQ